MAEPRLIRPLTDADRACLSCQVPGGRDEEHPMCRWRIFGGHGRRPLSARSIQMRERQCQILRYLNLMAYASSAELAYCLGWSRSAIRDSLVNLRDAGLVELIGGGRTARWRLTDDS